MPNMSSLRETPRRELHIFYVLDTSGSMEGSRIGELNDAMRETTRILSQQAESNADAILKIAVLEFNSNCSWLQPSGPELMEDFIWSNLTAGGLTEMGSALEELDSKLSKDAFLRSDTGAYLPIIIFMTDGYATDDYRRALEKIRQNKWFAHAIKIGFAIGDSPDSVMIADVVGNAEAVVITEELEVFARLLQFVSVRSSIMGSKSQTLDNLVTGASIIQEAIDEGYADEDVVDPDIPITPEPSQSDDWLDFNGNFLDF